ncbi:dienelactone hydrolase family protein [Maridesulfovibrio frigidus]|uniref:dienelactone hydrolase family protein n=1 Tax=Maridesulfovibrio frigidus TaxID=340956 RepID=UPI000AB4D31F|nr:dienelactone hydrolase family protein [Maridesulfovibrio frigidus]
MEKFQKVIHERIIHHEHTGTKLESVLVLPQGTGPFPTILLIHEYTGLNEPTLEHARRLSRAGYAVFAADFYGPDNRPQNVDEANKFHRVFRDDRLLMRERAKAFFEALIAQQEVDITRIAGLGFSFGGGAVLELARCVDQGNINSESALIGAISVYGYLDTTHPAERGRIKAEVITIHVENDPVVPEKHAEMFTNEMDEAEVEWSMIRFNNVQHGFANPDNPEFDSNRAEEAWDIILKALKEWF